MQRSFFERSQNLLKGTMYAVSLQAFLKEEYRHDKQNSNLRFCRGFAVWFGGLLFLQKGSVRNAAGIDDGGSARGTINNH